MNFSIIKKGLVAVAAMVSLSSFSQDLIARQAPIDKKLKSVDSLALQKQIRAEQSEYPALSLYPNWNNQYVHAYGNAIIPETYTIDLTVSICQLRVLKLLRLSGLVGEECIMAST